MSESQPEDFVAPEAFPNTRWTRVVDLHSENPALAQSALADLCETYWLPLYSYFRRNNQQPDDARDLTQSLFAEIISHDDLLKADSSKGKMRTFLLTLAKRHLIGTIRHNNAQKRGGSDLTFSLDEQDPETNYQREAIDNITPEKLFDRQWAQSLLNATRKALQHEYEKRDHGERFAIMARYLSWNESSEPNYQQSSEEAGLSEEAFRAAISRMRKRYRTLLREQVADTLFDPSNVDDELQSLFEALRP